MMLFHEIYSSYYNAVAAVLSAAVDGELNEKRLRGIVDEKAFSDSFLEIIPAIKSEKWRLLTSDLTTPICHKPTVPLTTLQLRWLKAVSLDKRIKLFDVNTDFLSDIEPLFVPEDYVLFDKYGDGDPFDDEEYISVFRTVLKAIREHRNIEAEYLSAKGKRRRITGAPLKLEFSEKDDKFRVRVKRGRFSYSLNLAGIKQCKTAGVAKCSDSLDLSYSSEQITVELTDERNALERFLLHFSHFKKEAVQLADNRYRITVYYDRSDETELVIRILSFGPFVKVQEPESFVNLIKERLIMQKSCGLK